MTPLHLQLRGFLSYRERTDLNLDGIGIACLSGDNGAGKSALLDAMTWALWGKTRSSSERELVTLGQRDMEVTFTFRLGERDYRVLRRRNYERGGSSGQATLEFYKFNPDAADNPLNKGWESITGDNIAQTQVGIQDVLNMSFDLFTSSAFIMQGNADSFTTKSPAERKKVLGEILSLQDYDELAKLATADAKAGKTQLEVSRARIADLEAALGDREMTKNNLEVVSNELMDLGTERDQAAAAHRVLADQLAIRNSNLTMLNQTRDRHDRSQRQLDELTQRQMQLHRDLAGIEQLLTQREEIEAGMEQLAEARTELTRLGQLRQRVTELQLAHSQAEAQLRSEQDKLERQIDGIQRDINNLKQQITRGEELDKQLAALRHEQAHTEQELLRIDALERERDELVTAQATLKAENIALKREMNAIVATRDQLQGDGLCPICRTPISEADFKRFHEEWTAEGTIKGDAFRANKVSIATNEQRATLIDADLRRLAQLSSAHQQRVGSMLALERERAGLDAARSNLANAEQELAGLQEHLNAKAFAPAARLNLQSAADELAASPFDPGAFEEVEQRVNRLQPLEVRLHELQRAETRREALQPQLEANTSQLAHLEAAIAEDRTSLNQLQELVDGMADIVGRTNAAQDTLDRLNAAHSRKAAELNTIHNDLRRLDAIERDRDALLAATADIAADQRAFELLADAFGRRGIQAMIIDNVLPDLQDEANELLSRMPGNQLNIEFRSQRLAVTTGNVSETLDIIISDDAGSRPYNLFSGGEAFRVNFAIRVALSKLLARRANATIDLLVIDEGFGTQDAQGRDGLVEALRSVERDFNTILVITHISEIREMFPTRIDVVKTDAGSRIAISG